MSELHRALGDIQSIRQQVADRTEFRGYGAGTLALTAAFAAAGAAMQTATIPRPANEAWHYTLLWMGVATLSGGVTAAQMNARSKREHSGISDEMIAMAAQQFLPALSVGLLLTLVLLQVAQQDSWLLPGLWQVIYALGIFASCRFMPRAMFTAGAWYLVTGLACIALGDVRAMSPLAMAVPFTVGQLLVAAVLWRSHGRKADEV